MIADPRPSARRAAMTILVRNRAKKVVLRRSYAHARTRLWLYPTFTCRLPRGTYRFSVYATDAAGNRQRIVGANKLTVR